jgi:hypothetical protein
MQIILGKWSDPAERKARQTTELAVHTTRMRIQTRREATHLHYWSPGGLSTAAQLFCSDIVGFLILAVPLFAR